MRLVVLSHCESEPDDWERPAHTWVGAMPKPLQSESTEQGSRVRFALQEKGEGMEAETGGEVCSSSRSGSSRRRERKERKEDDGESSNKGER